ESDSSTSIPDRGGVSLVQEDMIHVVEKIVDDCPIRVLAYDINSAGDCASSVDRLIRASRVAMDVHEDVPFDPGIRAVQIQTIVACSVKDVVDDLKNRPGPLTA